MWHVHSFIPSLTEPLHRACRGHAEDSGTDVSLVYTEFYSIVGRGNTHTYPNLGGAVEVMNGL